MMLVSIFLLAMMAGVTRAGSGTYVILSPSKLRASTDFSVSVNILTAPRDVAVTADIVGNGVTHATASGVFKAGVPQTLTLKIPRTLPRGSYSLKVEGSGGLTFTNSTGLAYTNKELSLFIQTDKGIYKPGDLVNFRVFGAYSDLKPYTGPVDINLFDEGGNKLKQWLQARPTDGVITGKFQLSSQPTLGDWKLSVLASRTQSEKFFTVAEYVLPKFEVEVVMPSFVLESDADVTVSIKSRYTYGKPVKGHADVTLGLLSRYSYNNPVTQASTVLHVPVDGEAKVTFPMTSVTALNRYLGGATLVVSANVTEAQTGKVMAGNGTVKIYQHAVKLGFLETNPKTFKPGLEYVALLKVSQPDDLPLTSVNEQLRVSTSVTVELPSTTTTTRATPIWGGYPQTKTISLPEVKYNIPSNGIVAIPLQVQSDARDVRITAQLTGVTARLNLGKSHSPSGSYMQLSLKTSSKIQAGDSIDLEIKSTKPLGQLVYQVMSRGKIVQTGSLTPQQPTKHEFSLVTDASMAPDARIVVYYVTQAAEIVTDSISFSVDGAFLNKVSVKVNTTQARPGEAVQVSVSADPNSVAHLMAVDQSVLLLKSGNDVTADDVLEELKTYDTISTPRSGGGCFNCRFRRAIWWGWPVFYGGSDAQQILQNSGVKVLTDCLVYHYVEPFRPIARSFFDRVGFGERFFKASKNVQAKANVVLTKKRKTDQAEPRRIRVNFAESFLWEDLHLRDNGTAATSAAIPDTITSWVVSAFATNSISGLGVSPTQAQVTVFKPFFVSLNLPYSVTRGEHVALQAIVFNYLQQDTQVRVTLAKSTNFYNIKIDASHGEKWAQEEVYVDIMAPAGQVKSVYFPIIPSELGRINIEVSARSTVAADALRRQLLVEAEGIPKEYNVPVLVDLTSGNSSLTKTVDLTLPAITVKGSELVRVSAVGDLMGPTVAGLDSLLRMPTGCGEQTMLGLAPDVYVTDYLKATNQLSADIENKALGFMDSGYQRELTYRHKDGSFSAFGERDDSGSMWLTAFVSRVFHQASAHVFVDENVIKRAINWMVQRQAANGSFPEPGRVIHKSMQGEAAQGIGLTCFVYISLLENQNLFSGDGPGSQFEQAKVKALSYLESQVALTSDLYVMAMASYAFQLAGSSQAQVLLDRLEKLAVKDGDQRYWHKQESTKPNTGHWRAPHPTRATDTEMTSYVLLAYAARSDIVSGKGIMQWVAQQRNPNGGFTSTQDTVVALNALSQFAKLTRVNNFHVHITSQLDASPTYTFDINDKNSLLVQTRETRTVPSKVKVKASGHGMALVQIAVFFNVESEVEDLTFDLTVNLIEETLNWLVLETCARWLGEEEASGMAVQEVGIPSGFAVDPELITKLPTLKRIEAQNKKVVLYFDQIGKTDVCISFRAERTSLVAKSQPAAIRVYDYYEPSNQVTVFYESKILKDSSVCQVCPECENCV